MTPEKSPTTDRRTPPRRHRQSKLYRLFHGKRTPEELEEEQEYVRGTEQENTKEIMRDAALDSRLPPAFA